MTRDFAFLGTLLAVWPEFCPEVLFFRNEQTCASCFRFEVTDGLLCLPLNGEPLTVDLGSETEQATSTSGLRIPYHEMEFYFVTRFFQYRLLRERERRLAAAPPEVLQHGLLEINNELIEELQSSLCLPPFTLDAAPRVLGPAAYCPLDGWILPAQHSFRPEEGPSVDYLVCPECMGNIAFEVLMS